MKEILGSSDILPVLFRAARLRESFFGKRVETCSILNAKSGRCPSDCTFCAQSSRYRADVREYPLLEKEKLIEKALEAFELGVDRFSFVTSGISPTPEEIRRIGEVVEELSSMGKRVCASLGQISKDALKFLKSCGLSRYHHNLETSREFYEKVSTVQRWEDRLRTVMDAKEVGFSVCCGGIFGLGESDDDIASLIDTLRKADVDSVPVNFLHPIRGTPLEGANYLTPLRCLKILCALRIYLPSKEIRVCGGREFNLRELQPLSLLAADSLMVGNYLTTKGRKISDDARMISDLGFESGLVRSPGG